MPSVSVAQRKLTGMAMHNPEKVSKKNKSILKMKNVDLKHFASTPEKGLPYKKGKKGKNC